MSVIRAAIALAHELKRDVIVEGVETARQLQRVAAPNPARADIGADRAQLLLEPWAVQAALHRRRGGNRLTDRERDEIRRCIRDPDSLRWPRGTEE